MKARHMEPNVKTKLVKKQVNVLKTLCSYF